MLKKILKALVITLVILCICSSMVMSQDTHHSKHCIEHNCPKCAIIMFAKTLGDLLKVFLFFISIEFLIQVFLCLKLFEEGKILRVSSLVYQKVQFNE